MTFFFVFFRRKRTKIRKKTKYTILDNMDDQERMELRPKYGKSPRQFPSALPVFNPDVQESPCENAADE